MDFVFELLTATLTSPWVYLLIGVAAGLDSLFPVVPSETLLISAAAFAASGLPDPVGLVAATVAGAILGDLAAHLVGRFGRSGAARFRRARVRSTDTRRGQVRPRSDAPESYGRREHRRGRRRQKRRALVESAREIFARRGGAALIAGRFVPGGRTLTTIGSGVLGFPVGRFLLWDGIGCLAWALYSTGIGLIGGVVFEDNPLLGVVLGIAIACAITGAAELARRLRLDRHPRRSGMMKGMSQKLVWYVSYGSNMARDRLACYLEGGRPPGAKVTYPGARDSAPPRAEAGIELPGTIYFAGSSKVWGGGMAFYDHAVPGPTPAKAYLITAEQFADVAAQEMHRPPEADSPLEHLVFDLPVGTSHAVGSGRYETLLILDDVDGVPMVTFTAPHSSTDIEHTPPEEAYLTMLRTGTAEVRDAGELPRRAAAQA